MYLDEKRIARNKRYKKKYGITLAEYEGMLVEQGGVCKCCGREPKPGHPLHVEHDHRLIHSANYEAVKTLILCNLRWVVTATTGLDTQNWAHETRPGAYALARQWVRRKSVRGLVCWNCNAGLRKFGNNSAALRAAADMLDKHVATL